MSDHGRCDHCGRIRGDLRTHLVPFGIKVDQHGKPMHEQARSLLLCGPCGDQRRRDLRAFFSGAPASRLVCIDPPPRPPAEFWESAV